MNTFRYKDKDIDFRIERGKVLSSEKSSDTVVTTTNKVQHGANLKTYVVPHVSSTTTRFHEIWIKKEDGSELDIKLVNTDVPLIIGHDVSFIIAENKKTNKSCYIALVNHTAGKCWDFQNAAGINKFFNLNQATGKSIFYGLLVWLGVSTLGGALGLYSSTAIGFGATVAGVFVLYRIVIKLKSVKGLLESLSGFVEGKTKDVLSKG